MSGTKTDNGNDPVSDPARVAPPLRRWPAHRVHRLSRAVILVLVSVSFAGLLAAPATWWGWTLDLLARSWLAFIGAVMAHEGVHGQLGRTLGANAWWGRLALLPVLVPFTNFRGTHLQHHRHTNEPGKDPDLFLKTPHRWELPLRALAMPHQWFFWMRRRGELPSGHTRDLVLNYLAIAACYLPVAILAGPWRIVTGVLPVCVLVSFVLWIPFAHLTHQGYSTGDPAARSHNYFGRLAYWFSFGLSMHREHHLRPHLAWVELYQLVQTDPRRRWMPRREIWRETPSEAV
jgi:fatty acid desaturase